MIAKKNGVDGPSSSSRPPPSARSAALASVSAGVSHSLENASRAARVASSLRLPDVAAVSWSP